MNKHLSDKLFGILLILLGFAIGYGIWMWGSQQLFMREAMKNRADLVYLFAFVPAVIIFFLWYRKQMSRVPIERQFSSQGQVFQIILIALITTVALVGLSFLLGFQAALLYSVLISVLITIFSGISFYRFRPY